jgi:16S rRNA U516 pseudouridylate synthase RsuA-like enzyme
VRAITWPSKTVHASIAPEQEHVPGALRTPKVKREDEWTQSQTDNDKLMETGEEVPAVELEKPTGMVGSRRLEQERRAEFIDLSLREVEHSDRTRKSLHLSLGRLDFVKISDGG